MSGARLKHASETMMNEYGNAGTQRAGMMARTPAPLPVPRLPPFRIQPPSLPRPRGFTLIELLVVVTIITVLSAGMIPVFLGNTDHMRLKASVRRMQDMMAFCRSMAAFESAAYRLNIDREVGKAWVSFEKEPIEEPGRFHPYRASGYDNYRFDAGIFVADLLLLGSDAAVFGEDEGAGGGSGEELYVEFRPDGTATESALILRNDKEECYSIVVSGLTGGVQIMEDEYSEEWDDRETDDARTGPGEEGGGWYEGG